MADFSPRSSRDSRNNQERHSRRGQGGRWNSDERRGRSEGGRGRWNSEDRRDRTDRGKEDRSRNDRNRNDGERGYSKRSNSESGRYRDDRRDNKRGDRRKHSQRGGADREKRFTGPMRSGYREERIKARQNEPDLPSDIDVNDLDPLVLQDLKVLAKDNADAVAKHMFMAATLMADDPALALRHARAAKDRAGRVSITRETCGIAAYHAGEWKEALAELRAARRISGGPGLLAVMADCERGLGRPEKVIEMAKTEPIDELDHDSQVEFAIVLAGARQDLQQLDAALLTLEAKQPSASAKGLSAARLSYAYANLLEAAGRTEEAIEWFGHADTQDEFGDLDAEERIEEIKQASNG